MATDILVSSLSTTPSVGQIGVVAVAQPPAGMECLVYMQPAKVEVWAATTNNRANAAKVGETTSGMFVHGGLPNSATRYYWARAVDGDGNLGAYYPASATAGVSATTLTTTPGPGSITTDMLADRSITSGKIGIGAIIAELIASLAVTADKLAAASVTTAKLADEAVAAGKLAANSVTNTALADAVVTAAKIADATLTAAKFASTVKPIEVFDTLVAAGSASPEGRTIYVKADDKLYRATGSAWIASVAAVDLTGQLTNSQLADGAITAAKIADAAITATKFAASIKPVEIFDTLVAAGAATPEGRFIYVKADDKTYRATGASWISTVAAVDVTGQIVSAQLVDGAITELKLAAAAVTSAKIATSAITESLIANGAVVASKIADGTLTAAKFATDVVPIESFATLPTTGNFEGRIVYLKSDDKLYRYTGSAWVATVAAVDVTGQITSTQITDSSITTAKLAAGAVTADTLAANSVIFGKVAAGAIGVDQLRANSITSSKLLIGNSTNLISDSTFATGAAVDWSLTNGASQQTVVARTAPGVPANAPTPYVMKYTANGAPAISTASDALPYTNPLSGIAVIPGEQYLLSIDVASDGDTNPFNIYAIYLTTAGVYQSGPTINAPVLAADGWTTRSLNITIPSNIARLHIYPLWYNSAGGNIYWTNARILRRNDGQLIVDGAITAAKLDAGSVTTAKLAAGAVTANELASNSVTAVKIVSGTITGDKLVAGTITALQLAAGAVTTTKLAAGAVTADSLAANAVTTDKLAANSVTVGKVAAAAIGAEQIQAKAIRTTHLSIGSTINVIPNDIWTTGDASGWYKYVTPANQTVLSKDAPGVPASASQLYVVRLSPASTTVSIVSHPDAYGAVGAGEPVSAGDSYQVTFEVARSAALQVAPIFYVGGYSASGAFVSSASQTLTLSADNTWEAKSISYTVPAGVVSIRCFIWWTTTSTSGGNLYLTNVRAYKRYTGELIVDGSIYANNLATDSVTAAKIASGAVTADELAANSVTATALAANSVTADKLAANSVVAGKVAAGAIGTDQLIANSITVSKLVVTGSGNAINPDPAFEDAALWAGNTSGITPTVATSSTAYQGNKVLQSSAIQTGVYYDNNKIAIDPNKTYLLEIVARRPTGNGIFYGAWRFWNAAGSAIPSGGTGWSFVASGNHYYPSVSGLPASWDRYTLTVGPNGTATFPPGAAFVSYGFLFNYSATGTVLMEIGLVRVTEMARGELIIDGAITASKIAAEAVTTTKLAAGAVTADQLAANSVTAGKVAANAILAASIASGAVTTAKLAAGAVTATELASGSVTTIKLEAGSVTASRIYAGSITATEIANSTITGAKIVGGTITGALLADATITTAKIANAAITNAKIDSLSADKLTAGTISAAISITSPTINGGTITGTLLRTASSGGRIQISSSSNTLDVIDSSGNYRVTLGVVGTNSLVAASYASGATAAYFGASSNSASAYALRGTNTGSGGGYGAVGISGADGGYAVTAITGKINSPAGYAPFTGMHEMLCRKDADLDLGDIAYVVKIIARGGLDNVLAEVARTDSVGDRRAIGVVSERKTLTETQWLAALEDRPNEGVVSPVRRYIVDTFDMVTVNALGEGQMDVCGRGGDIGAGDFIVTSDLPGKGQRQNDAEGEADDLLRRCTVAQTMEAVAFDSLDQIKRVACFYRCG